MSKLHFFQSDAFVSLTTLHTDNEMCKLFFFQSDAFVSLTTKSSRDFSSAKNSFPFAIRPHEHVERFRSTKRAYNNRMLEIFESQLSDVKI